MVYQSEKTKGSGHTRALSVFCIWAGEGSRAERQLCLYKPCSPLVFLGHTDPTAKCLGFTLNSVEDFWHKSLNGLEPLHHKPQRGELAAAIADELLCQHLGENPLQPQGLEPGEGSSWKRRAGEEGGREAMSRKATLAP